MNDPLKPEPKPFDWGKIFTGDLNRFRLALHAGHSVTDARRIAATPKAEHYDQRSINDAARVWGNGGDR